MDAETITEEGDPKTAICNVVQKLNVNMLVVGESGLGKIKRLVFFLITFAKGFHKFHF